MHPISIGDALFSRTQQRVLALLFGKPDHSFFANEVVRSASMGRGTVRRELERLVKAGLLIQRRTGNQLHYQANPGCPIYNEILGIVRKTFGIADVIRAALEPLGSKIQYAFIFGSIAKDTATGSSDVDLLVIAKKLSYTAVMDCLLAAEDSLQRKINPVVYTLDDFSSRLAKGHSFIKRVMEQELITIKGVKDDFGEPAAHKPAQGRGT